MSPIFVSECFTGKAANVTRDKLYSSRKPGKTNKNIEWDEENNLIASFIFQSRILSIHLQL